jgi:hypothetical protein
VKTFSPQFGIQVHCFKSFASRQQTDESRYECFVAGETIKKAHEANGAWILLFAIIDVVAEDMVSSSGHILSPLFASSISAGFGPDG